MFGRPVTIDWPRNPMALGEREKNEETDEKKDC